ncbi:glycosyltransferase family 2 protein [Serinibacter salmoneus]|uniref:GT2 family glycosyltransferase n=1 Tax=Serinibacter salmoneus TaxID=556530 RepID=A0A2A9D117_9MICO|nr:glycosyltransferase family 2 protein [Serinibacter salmoneus]PFG19540.1 GT2 family glycosyltransferase [Serinibacter salmoneus]
MSAHSVSLVVCAYTGRRWRDLCAGIAAVAAGSEPPEEIVVVIDHNEGLRVRAAAELPAHAPGVAVRVMSNTRRQGLSGARNTGVGAAHGEIVAFLDDDATPRRDWLERMLEPFVDPRVVAVGGAAEPVWPASGRPACLPTQPGQWGELDWVVGCSYRGLPRTRAQVRNVMGCAMAIRREAMVAAGGFHEDLGRVGRTPLGCEETELSIRLRQRDTPARVVLVPEAVVDHRVSEDRVTWRYLATRGWAEGVSKSAVAALVGPGDALATESSYLAGILPRALLRELGSGRAAGAVAVLLAVAATGAGYLRGSLDTLARRRRQVAPPAQREGTRTG